MWNKKNFLHYSGEIICVPQEFDEFLPPSSKLLHSNDLYTLLSDFSQVISLFFTLTGKNP